VFRSLRKRKKKKKKKKKKEKKKNVGSSIYHLKKENY